jgi:rod shape determining protein RodA
MMPRFNKTVLACVLLLSAMGVLSLWTQAPPSDLSGESITKSIFLKHVTFLGAALAILGLSALPHYQLYRRLAYVLYGACVIALAALLIKGNYTRGARGWFALGPINVQPAEFFKIAYVLTIARVLMYGRAVQTWSGVALPVLLTALPAGLILLQPDLGTTLLFVPTLLVMLYAAGARRSHLLIIITTLLIAAPIGYFFVLKDYQRNRLIAFAVPDQVPPALTYQVKRSIEACAAGRLMGNGLGESGQNTPFHIPDRHTDFVYSIIAEELGFVGSTFVLLLFAGLYGQSLWIAFQSREPFGRLVVAGLTTLLATQTLINLGMTVGVAPITGVTLPFISYGGSSLLTCALAAGLTLNVSARWQPGFSARDMAGGSVEISSFQPQPVKWLAH